MLQQKPLVKLFVAASRNISFHRIAQLMALDISAASSVGMRVEKVALLRLQGFQP